MNREAGKGSKRRPLKKDKKQFDENWDRIFGKKTLEGVKDGKASDVRNT